jgi:tetratricopeptide (TPR) repeat protein
MDPLLPYPHYHIGIYQNQHGNPQAAIEQFQKVMELTQNDTGLLASLRADTLLRMHSAYDAIGDYANAEKCLSMAAQERRKQHNFEANTFP